MAQLTLYYMAFLMPHLLEEFHQMTCDGQPSLISPIGILNQVLCGGQPIFTAPRNSLDLLEQSL